MKNLDERVVEDFGGEWELYDQSGLSSEDQQRLFADYFSEFPWAEVPEDACGFDVGCGSGRWAELVAARVGRLHCIDASPKALAVAQRKLARFDNVSFHRASVDTLPLEPASMDFGYSLGVLHHVPDTQAAIRSCVEKLKPGAPFLVYLYYAFDNRPRWYRGLWRASEWARAGISRSPRRVKVALTSAIAASVYYPAARTSGLLHRMGVPVNDFPLSAYRTESFYTMRTDALDRFGTRLEQRFSKTQITQLMTTAGLERIRFREGVPYWCAVGYRRTDLQFHGSSSPEV